MHSSNFWTPPQVLGQRCMNTSVGIPCSDKMADRNLDDSAPTQTCSSKLRANQKHGTVPFQWAYNLRLLKPQKADSCPGAIDKQGDSQLPLANYHICRSYLRYGRSELLCALRVAGWPTFLDNETSLTTSFTASNLKLSARLTWK